MKERDRDIWVSKNFSFLDTLVSNLSDEQRERFFNELKENLDKDKRFQKLLKKVNTNELA